MEGIKFFLEDSIYEPAKFRIELKNDTDKTDIFVERDTLNRQLQINISQDQLNVKLFFSLGYGLCYTAYHWNKNLVDRIRKRDEFDFLGRMIFSGSDEEKQELNRLDRLKLIHIEDGFFENFTSNFLKNNSGISIDNLSSKTFRTDLNFNNIDQVVDKFNQKFNTDFEVTALEDDDQLSFATISFTKTQLIHVFGLGADLCLADEVINEQIRGASL